ncbi:hypothetical protein B0H14DRAFT_3751865 [Mycena olivaceomarginata]|nr:hypothetical protein B0H14DRAFT_3751865 [Mycena olivaceomarginata]
MLLANSADAACTIQPPELYALAGYLYDKAGFYLPPQTLSASDARRGTAGGSEGEGGEKRIDAASAGTDAMPMEDGRSRRTTKCSAEIPLPGGRGLKGIDRIFQMDGRRLFVDIPEAADRGNLRGSHSTSIPTSERHRPSLPTRMVAFHVPYKKQLEEASSELCRSKGPFDFDFDLGKAPPLIVDTDAVVPRAVEEAVGELIKRKLREPLLNVYKPSLPLTSSIRRVQQVDQRWAHFWRVKGNTDQSQWPRPQRYRDPEIGFTRTSGEAEEDPTDGGANSARQRDKSCQIWQDSVGKLLYSFNGPGELWAELPPNKYQQKSFLECGIKDPFYSDYIHLTAQESSGLNFLQTSINRSLFWSAGFPGELWAELPPNKYQQKSFWSAGL